VSFNIPGTEKGGYPMDMDDLLPKNKQPQKKNLEELSIEALNEYIAELETEIERTRDEIKKKEAARLGAESFFKK
jgi:uncharacterized small protein (DUF1192 family)